MTSSEPKLTDFPLRQPGQGVRAMLYELQDDAAIWVAMFALSMGMCIGVFIGYGLRERYPWPHIVAILLLLGVIIRMVLWRRWSVKRAKNILLGYDGERIVAERLDALKELGYRIIHDIPSLRDGGANIDHLVVGPRGIFVIETKMRSRPEGRKATVTYDGQTLLVDGYRPDRDPIAQVHAVSHELIDWLKAETGRDVARLVRPVVVFPGWYIDERKRPRPFHEWVLHEDSFTKWVHREKSCVSPDDVALFSNRVEERVRRHQREAAKK